MSTEDRDYQRAALGNFEGEFKSPDYVIFMASLVVSLVIGEFMKFLFITLCVFLYVIHCNLLQS